ncbi:MAG: peptidoglycan-binding domain-containing protein [Patescibacteria group bacterium]
MKNSISQLNILILSLILVTPLVTQAQYGGGGGPIGLFGSVNVNTSGPVSAGQVLGATTDASGSIVTCHARFSEYAMKGRNTAGPETIKNLQSFLNEYQDAKLPITGVYGSLTIAALNQFQLANLSDVLAPWNLTEPTGNFYMTTRRKANIEYCKLRGVVLNIPMFRPADLIPWAGR